MRLDLDKAIIEGDSTVFRRTCDDGGFVKFHFCPICGSTLYWFLEDDESFVGKISVAAGNFQGAKLPSPTFSVYKAHKFDCVEIPKSVIDDWD